MEIESETKEWLEKLAIRHGELLKGEMKQDLIEWQKRLVTVLAAHQDIPSFEEMFYEFLGNLVQDAYKAAVVLLEETGNEKEFRRLLAVLANKELRREFFGF